MMANGLFFTLDKQAESADNALRTPSEIISEEPAEFSVSTPPTLLHTYKQLAAQPLAIQKRHLTEQGIRYWTGPSGIRASIGVAPLAPAAQSIKGGSTTSPVTLVIEPRAGQEEIVTTVRLNDKSVLVTIDSNDATRLFSVYFTASPSNDGLILDGVSNAAGIVIPYDAPLEAFNLAAWVAYTVLRENHAKYGKSGEKGGTLLGPASRSDCARKCYNHDDVCSFITEFYVFVPCSGRHRVEGDTKCCQIHDRSYWCASNAGDKIGADNAVASCLMSRITDTIFKYSPWYCIFPFPFFLLALLLGLLVAVLARIVLVFVDPGQCRIGGGAGWSCLCGGNVKTYWCKDVDGNGKPFAGVPPTKPPKPICDGITPICGKCSWLITFDRRGSQLISCHKLIYRDRPCCPHTPPNLWHCPWPR